MGADIPIRCSCGQLKGVLKDVTRSKGSHAQCFCSSCRAAELHLGQADPAPGPIDVFQTNPHRVQLTEGTEHLAVFAYDGSNLRRWYASCCGTPMFNTFKSPRIPFVGIRTSCLPEKDALGPIIAQGSIPTPDGKERHQGVPKLVWRLMKRVLADRLTGRWKQTPLFDIATGKLTREVTVLPKGTRQKLLENR